MGLVGEFKEFAMKGSVLDMAIGIIIGVAFGSVVNSLVKDIIMPPIGLVLGKWTLQTCSSLRTGSTTILWPQHKQRAPLL